MEKEKERYFIIYDDIESEKATPNKKQFLDSLLYTMCYACKDDISKEDIYYNMMMFENDDDIGTGTIIEVSFNTIYNNKITYKKYNY